MSPRKNSLNCPRNNLNLFFLKEQSCPPGKEALFLGEIWAFPQGKLIAPRESCIFHDCCVLHGMFFTPWELAWDWHLIFFCLGKLLLKYRNPSLRLVTKARGCKVAGQERDPRITSHAPRSAKSVRE
jgi:hypothetical protein